MGVGSAPHRRRRGGTRPTLWCEGRGLEGKVGALLEQIVTGKRKKGPSSIASTTASRVLPSHIHSGVADQGGAWSTPNLQGGQSRLYPQTWTQETGAARHKQRGYKTQANHYTDEAYSLQSDCGAGLGRSDSDEMADSDIDLASGRRPRAMKTRFGRESRGSSGMVRQ